MNLTMLLEMAAQADPDRIAIGTRREGLSVAALCTLSHAAGARFREQAGQRVVWTDISGPALPVALFGAAYAQRPFVPLNYRLADTRLRDLVARQTPALAICGPGTENRLAGIDSIEIITAAELLADAAEAAPPTLDAADEGDDVAILLHTSGTSGEPKAAMLRHRHLTSYVIGSVEFNCAGPDEATLVTVPPYHVAGMSAILTALYSGRRLVQLANFDAAEWVRIARYEAITHAMVVPTMLARINEVLRADDTGLPSLRHLAYGGGRMPLPVVEETMRLLPGVDMVNAYGLTETSSSVAVLGADDHRIAVEADDPSVRRRLSSVGRPLPSVEITIRDEHGKELPAGTPGEVWVRGDQVSGEYTGRDASGDGWFATNDGGWLDEDGFLYVTGRLDDVIVRGGENLSPGEIEDVLLQHDAVREACVVGIPDTEWGEAVAAAVVLHDDASATATQLADWVTEHLRSSRRPAVVEFVDQLPLSDTGKILRRIVRADLSQRCAGN